MPANQPIDLLASEVEQARNALIEAAGTKPKAWWTTDDLRSASRGRWRGTVFMIALDELLSEKKLEASPRWRIRLRTHGPVA
jgi:hypothetical protein